MAKYRGQDGWLHDDSVEGPRRYHNKEKVSGPQQKRKVRTKCPNCNADTGWRRMEARCALCGWREAPPTAQADPNKGPRSKCPNCDLSVSWRRLEGYCRNCGWGRSKSTDPDRDVKEIGYCCCGTLAFLILSPLIGAGMGYGVWGLGGLLVGTGIGLAIPIGVMVLALISASKTEKK